MCHLLKQANALNCDRLRDRLTGGHAYGWTDWQTNILMDGLTERHTHTERLMSRR